MSSSLLPLSSTFKTRTNQTHGFEVSCNGAQDNHNHEQLILPRTQNLTRHNVDRRNLLMGLAGLCTTANLTSLPGVIAAPITAPNITLTCKDVEEVLGIKNIEDAVRARKCCPPNIRKTIKPFVFPRDSKVRMRWAAHRGTPEEIDNYRRAIQAMRDLPEDHPHSLTSQAKTHCAYCDGHYSQVDSGFPLINIHIHSSWLFFPFHRWFLYFHERILGKLINDPSFALPYWQWDEPAGMSIPKFFVPEKIDLKSNPLYDPYRNANHVQSIVDLDYDMEDKKVPNETQIMCNLSTVYRDLVRNGGDTISFFGGEYKAGDSPISNKDPSVGSLESGSHNAVHRWVGDPTTPNYEDMGNFYSAGYDPLFYAHHANVDRLWKLWKDLDLHSHREPKSNDWLNASYVFYDENEELVRVYNKDCVNLNKLNYNYIENSNSKEVFPWMNTQPPKHSEIIKIEKFVTVERFRFPLRLNEILKVRVKRPDVKRTEAEKERAREVLLIRRIKFDSGKFVKFDVFVNGKVKDGKVGMPCDREYAGGFAQIPRNDKRNMFMYSSVRFGLDELLEDTNSEVGEYATVLLVPRAGCEDLTVGEIKIELVPI